MHDIPTPKTIVQLVTVTVSILHFVQHRGYHPLGELCDVIVLPTVVSEPKSFRLGFRRSPLLALEELSC